jgi:hypothetical protein
MQRVLSFEQGPPLSGPLRFFLTAPLFAVLAALLLLWQGEAGLTSRWTPATLALTHLLTLGFLAMVMVGALLQILPVVAGVEPVRPRLTAAAVHLCLSAGTLCLAAGFVLMLPVLFQVAVPLLLAGFGWLLVAVFVGMLRAQPAGAAATVAAIRLALAALLATVALGAALGGAFGWGLAIPVMLLTDLHAAWGLLGWVGLLAIGVAYQIIPMFQVTPPYPRSVTAWLAWLAVMALAAWSTLGAWPGLGAAGRWAGLPLAAVFGGFALITLYLLSQRKRPKPDVTTLFWRLAMACLLLCAVLYCLPQDAADGTRPLWLGILFIVGFAVSVVNGMLYKIVPFLVWYHLQSLPGLERKTLPSLKLILPERAAMQQFWLHLAALALLAAAVLAPAALGRAAALMLGISAWKLWFNLIGAARMYRHIRMDAGSALVAA